MSAGSAAPDPAPAQSPGAATPLGQRFASVATWRHGPAGGKPLWQLRFEAPGPAPAEAPAWRVRICGVPGTAVQWVRLRQPDQVLFEMDSRQVGLGHISTAGEIIEAMAAMNGHRGMLIDCGRFGPAPRQTPTTVDLLLNLPRAHQVQQVHVQAEIQPGA